MRAIYVSIPPARRVLDFGCGSGWVLAEADKTGSPFCVGVDCSLASLQAQGVPAICREAARSEVHLVAGDGLRLPFPDQVFDVVIGHVSMPYMNTRAGLKEVYRVLAPGGSILLTFHNYRYLRRSLAYSLVRGQWKNVLFMAYLATNGLLNHLSLPQTQCWWKRRLFETVNTRRGVCEAARKAGFVQVSGELATPEIFFTVTARKAGPNGVLPAPAYAVFSKLS